MPNTNDIPAAESAPGLGSALTLAAKCRAEAEIHQTVYADDRRRKALFSEVANMLESLSLEGDSPHMNEEAEYQLWYRLKRAQKASHQFCELLSRAGTKEEKEAYKDGYYAVCVGLDCMFLSKPEVRARCEARDAELKRKADEYFGSLDAATTQRNK